MATSSTGTVAVWVAKQKQRDVRSSSGGRAAGDTTLWTVANYDQKTDEFWDPSSDERWGRGEFEEVLPANSVTSADMTSLDHIHEPAVLSNLADRWEQTCVKASSPSGCPSDGKLPYTFMSVVLISLNPCEWLVNPPYSAYRDKAFDPSKPHPYALAELAFQQLTLAHASSHASSPPPSAASGPTAALASPSSIGLAMQQQQPVNQSVVISGESGAGKTETAKMILPYLTTCSASSGSTPTSASSVSASKERGLDERIVQTNPVFECFGNAKTLRNHNSSRFGKFITLRFANQSTSSSSPQSNLSLWSAVMETYLLERSRVTSPSKGERNFHAFYQLAAADASLTTKVGLDASSLKALLPAPSTTSPRASTVDSFAWLACTGCASDARLRDGDLWKETEAALSVCGLSEEERVHVWSTTAAVLHLGNVNFSAADQDNQTDSQTDNQTDANLKLNNQRRPLSSSASSLSSKANVGNGASVRTAAAGGGEKCVVENEKVVELVARLLGLGLHDSATSSSSKALCKFLTTRTIKTVQETLSIPLSASDASHCRDGLARALYDAVFEYLVAKMNAKLAPSTADAAAYAARGGGVSGAAAASFVDDSLVDGGGESQLNRSVFDDGGGVSGEDDDEDDSDSESDVVSSFDEGELTCESKVASEEGKGEGATKLSTAAAAAAAMSAVRFKHDVREQLATTGRVKRILADSSLASGSPSRSLSPTHGNCNQQQAQGLGADDSGSSGQEQQQRPRRQRRVGSRGKASSAAAGSKRGNESGDDDDDGARSSSSFSLSPSPVPLRRMHVEVEVEDAATKALAKSATQAQKALAKQARKEARVLEKKAKRRRAEQQQQNQQIVGKGAAAASKAATATATVLSVTSSRGATAEGKEGAAAAAASASSEMPWIGILDIFGFEHFESNGFQTFLINTANESIQNTFNHFVFEAELRLFEEEGISLRLGMSAHTPVARSLTAAATTKAITGGGDSGSDDDDDEDSDAEEDTVGNEVGGGSGGVNGDFVCPDNRACTEALKSILKAVESVSREPEPSDGKLLRRINTHLAPPTVLRATSSSSSTSASSAAAAPHATSAGSATSPSSASSSKAKAPPQRPSDFFIRGGGGGGRANSNNNLRFGILHFAGEVPYTVTSWVEKNTDYLPEGSVQLLKEHSPPSSSSANSPSSTSSPGGSAGGGGGNPIVLRRVMQAQTGGGGKGGGGGGKGSGAGVGSSFLKKATVADSFMRSMHSLMDTLRATQCSFIRCVKPNATLTPHQLDKPLVCSQLRSLGIIQTCEVLKAGLPTRVPHAALLKGGLGASSPQEGGGGGGMGGAPKAVATLMEGQPLVVRVALVLKLYQVPSDAYRVGKTRIFFKAGHIASIRRILNESLPLSDAEALDTATQLLELYRKTAALAAAVTATAAEVGPGAVAQAAKCREAAFAALRKAQASADALCSEMEAATAKQAQPGSQCALPAEVAQRVGAVRALADKAKHDPRFAGLKAVEQLLLQAEVLAGEALKGAHKVAQQLSSAQECQQAFAEAHAEAVEATAAAEGNNGSGGSKATRALNRDVAKVTKFAARLGDSKSWAIMANQAALRLEYDLVVSMQRKVERTQAKVAPALERLEKRVAEFQKASESPELKRLASKARQALVGVESSQLAVARALTEAEGIVKPDESGKCEVAWVRAEVKLIEGIARDECKRAFEKAAKQRQASLLSSSPGGGAQRAHATDDVKKTSTSPVSAATNSPPPPASSSSASPPPLSIVAAAVAGYAAGAAGLTLQETTVVKANFLQAQQQQQQQQQHAPPSSSSPPSDVISRDSFGWLLRQLSAGPGSSSEPSSSPSSPLRLIDPHCDIAADALDAAYNLIVNATAISKGNNGVGGGVTLDDLMAFYAKVKAGQVAGISAPQKSFPLLVNCRRRRPGWKVVGKELLKRDPAAIKRANSSGVTALAAACHAGHLDVVEWCIAQGSELDRGNVDGVTPVATAAARGHVEVVRAMTSAGAEVATGNADGDSVVAIACWEDHFEIVRYLGSLQQQQRQQQQQQRQQRRQVIPATTFVRLDSRNLDGISPLEVACMRGNLNSVMVLHELKVNMDEVNEHGDTPFLIACWEGHLDVVKFLFRVGKDSAANRMNANGDTPLAVAAWEGHLHVVSFLTAVGVELQAKNADGLTAYDVVVMRQHPFIVKFFQGQGIFNSKAIQSSSDFSGGAGGGSSSSAGGASSAGMTHDVALRAMITQERQKANGNEEQKTNAASSSSPQEAGGGGMGMVKLSTLKAAAQTIIRRLKTVEEADRLGLLSLSSAYHQSFTPRSQEEFAGENKEQGHGARGGSEPTPPPLSLPSSPGLPTVGPLPNPPASSSFSSIAKAEAQNKGVASSFSSPHSPGNTTAAAMPKAATSAAVAKLSARISTPTDFHPGANSATPLLLRRSISGSSMIPSSSSSTRPHEKSQEAPPALAAGAAATARASPSLPTNAAGSSSSQQQPQQQPHLSVVDRTKSKFDAPFLGKRVTVSGTNKKEINGCAGVATRFDSKTGRYVIKLDNGRTFQLKVGNIRWEQQQASQQQASQGGGGAGGGSGSSSAVPSPRGAPPQTPQGSTSSNGGGGSGGLKSARSSPSLSAMTFRTPTNHSDQTAASAGASASSGTGAGDSAGKESSGRVSVSKFLFGDSGQRKAVETPQQQQQPPSTVQGAGQQQQQGQQQGGALVAAGAAAWEQKVQQSSSRGRHMDKQAPTLRRTLSASAYSKPSSTSSMFSSSLNALSQRKSLLSGGGGSEDERAAMIMSMGSAGGNTNPNHVSSAASTGGGGGGSSVGSAGGNGSGGDAGRVSSSSSLSSTSSSQEESLYAEKARAKLSWPEEQSHLNVASPRSQSKQKRGGLAQQQSGGGVGSQQRRRSVSGSPRSMTSMMAQQQQQLSPSNPSQQTALAPSSSSSTVSASSDATTARSDQSVAASSPAFATATPTAGGASLARNSNSSSSPAQPHPTPHRLSIGASTPPSPGKKAPTPTPSATSSLSGGAVGAAAGAAAAGGGGKDSGVAAMAAVLNQPFKGKRVVVRGTIKADANGKPGVATRFDEGAQRYVVKMDDGRLLRLKAQNLVLEDLNAPGAGGLLSPTAAAMASRGLVRSLSSSDNSSASAASSSASSVGGGGSRGGEGGAGGEGGGGRVGTPRVNDDDDDDNASVTSVNSSASANTLSDRLALFNRKHSSRSSGKSKQPSSSSSVERGGGRGVQDQEQEPRQQQPRGRETERASAGDGRGVGGGGGHSKIRRTRSASGHSSGGLWPPPPPPPSSPPPPLESSPALEQLEAAEAAAAAAAAASVVTGAAAAAGGDGGGEGATESSKRRRGHGLDDNIYKKWMTDKVGAAADEDDADDDTAHGDNDNGQPPPRSKGGGGAIVSRQDSNISVATAFSSAEESSPDIRANDNDNGGGGDDDDEGTLLPADTPKSPPSAGLKSRRTNVNHFAAAPLTLSAAAAQQDEPAEATAEATAAVPASTSLSSAPVAASVSSALVTPAGKGRRMTKLKNIRSSKKTAAAAAAGGGGGSGNGGGELAAPPLSSHSNALDSGSSSSNLASLAGDSDVAVEGGFSAAASGEGGNAATEPSLGVDPKQELPFSQKGGNGSGEELTTAQPTVGAADEVDVGGDGEDDVGEMDRSYVIGDGLNVFIVSNDPRLGSHSQASPFQVIEYNGHDAFEFGAVGQVTAKLDARPPPLSTKNKHHRNHSEAIEALFTFQHLNQYHPDDRGKALANTNQLLKQLSLDSELRQRQQQSQQEQGENGAASGHRHSPTSPTPPPPASSLPAPATLTPNHHQQNPPRRPHHQHQTQRPVPESSKRNRRGDEGGGAVAGGGGGGGRSHNGEIGSASRAPASAAAPPLASPSKSTGAASSTASTPNTKDFAEDLISVDIGEFASEAASNVLAPPPVFSPSTFNQASAMHNANAEGTAGAAADDNEYDNGDAQGRGLQKRQLFQATEPDVTSTEPMAATMTKPTVAAAAAAVSAVTKPPSSSSSRE